MTVKKTSKKTAKKKTAKKKTAKKKKSRLYESSGYTGAPVRGLGVKKHEAIQRIEDFGGLDGICEYILNNNATRPTVAEAIGISYEQLRYYIHHPKHPERKAQIENAEKETSYLLLDEAKKIIDEVPVDKAAIMKARERVAFRKYMASCLNKDRFSEKKEVDLKAKIDPTLPEDYQAMQNEIDRLNEELAELEKPTGG